MVLRPESLVVVRADEIEPLIEVANNDRVLKKRLGEYATEEIVFCMGVYQGSEEDLESGSVDILGGIVLTRDGADDLRAEEIFVTETVGTEDPNLVGSVEKPLVEASKQLVGLMFRKLRISKQEIGESDREALEPMLRKDTENPNDLVWEDTGWPSEAQKNLQVVSLEK